VVDEHGRFERRRRVPDVLERERKQKKAPPEKAEPRVPDEPTVLESEADLSEGPDPEEPLASGDDAPKVPDAGFWSSLEVRRRLIIAGVVFAGVVAVAGLAWGVWSLANTAEPTPAPVPGTPFVPSEQPSESVGATASATASGSVAVSGSVSATPPAPAGPRVPVRAPLITYRAGGAVWVSGEHGGTPRSVYPASGAGVFALSPDGLVLAYIDAAAGVLRLIDLTSGRNTPVGPALALRPDWAPDSSFVAYTRPAGAGRSEEVCRVPAAGGAVTPLVKGWKGRVMAGGSVVAAAPLPPLSPTGPVALLSDGRKVALAGTARSDEVCPDIGGVYWVELGAGGDGDTAALPSIRWVRYDGKGSRTLVQRPAATARVAFAGLTLSPDGKWLVYAETGDDGYSRLFAVPAAGGAPVTLSPRYDGYALSWSADGTELFFVEGNAIQGEATRVSAVHPDGTAHRIVVEGGGL
jgi:hypothetical protein